jgi:UDP-3-O-[3-hydroxymyristoyl] N-acetylglucosamine deacetylase/3-hydroxyacyl-[acyl-carrier-protein] dehydratase
LVPKSKVNYNKPGHFVNTQFAKMAKIIKIEHYVPVYDLNLEPLMDIHKIWQFCRTDHHFY